MAGAPRAGTLALLLLGLCQSAWAQEDGGAAPLGEAVVEHRGRDVADLSLDELLNTPVAVASQKAATVRETPGIVTVIARDEIQASGARDLVDVLMLVPGF